MVHMISPLAKVTIGLVTGSIGSIRTASRIASETEAVAVLVVPLREFVTVTEYEPLWLSELDVKLYWAEVA